MKIAVHLKTQKEFNEYMKYAEKKGWGWIDDLLPIAPNDGPKRNKYKENTYIVYGDNMYLTHFIRKYQVLTLQEVIEQEKNDNVNIIGKKYRSHNGLIYIDPKITIQHLDENGRPTITNISGDIVTNYGLQLVEEKEQDNTIKKDREPKTGDWVMASDNQVSWCKVIYLCTIDKKAYKYVCTDEIGSLEISYWGYIKSYEEPKQEIPEWIEKAAEDLNKTGDRGVYKGVGLEQLSDAVLKHMPKQDVIKLKEREFFESQYVNGMTPSKINLQALKQMLQDRGLIQE